MMSEHPGHFIHMPSGSSFLSVDFWTFTPCLARCSQDIGGSLPVWPGENSGVDYRRSPPAHKLFAAGLLRTPARSLESTPKLATNCLYRNPFQGRRPLAEGGGEHEARPLGDGGNPDAAWVCATPPAACRSRGP